MCKVPLTIKQILLDHDSFKQICWKYYQSSNLGGFKNSKPEGIISFLKKTTFSPKSDKI